MCVCLFHPRAVVCAADVAAAAACVGGWAIGLVDISPGGEESGLIPISKKKLFRKKIYTITTITQKCGFVWAWQVLCRTFGRIFRFFWDGPAWLKRSSLELTFRPAYPPAPKAESTVPHLAKVESGLAKAECATLPQYLCLHLPAKAESTTPLSGVHNPPAHLRHASTTVP